MTAPAVFAAGSEPIDRTWTELFPAAAPPARHYHVMATDGSGDVVLFAGLSTYTPGPLGDTWVWNGSTWTPKSPTVAPPNRTGHAMAADKNDSVVLFGGSGASVLGDTWLWGGGTWTEKFPASSPSPRENHAVASDGSGNVVLQRLAESKLRRRVPWLDSDLMIFDDGHRFEVCRHNRLAVALPAR